MKKIIVMALLAASLVGCALTREESSQRALTATDYQLCEAIQVGIALNEVRFPDTVFNEIARRKLDCSPYAKVNEDRLKVALTRIANAPKTVTVKEEPKPFQFQVPGIYQDRSTHCRPDYAGGMRCTHN